MDGNLSLLSQPAFPVEELPSFSSSPLRRQDLPPFHEKTLLYFSTFEQNRREKKLGKSFLLLQKGRAKKKALFLLLLL